MKGNHMSILESTKAAADAARDKAFANKPKSPMAKHQEKCQWGDKIAKPAPKKKKKKSE